MIHIITMTNLEQKAVEEIVKSINVMNQVIDRFSNCINDPNKFEICIDPLYFTIALHGSEVYKLLEYKQLSEVKTIINRYRKCLDSFFKDVIGDIDKTLKEKEEKEPSLEDMSKEELLQYIKDKGI